MGTDTRLHAFLNSAVDGQSGWLLALVALVLIKEPVEALNNDVSRALGSSLKLRRAIPFLLSLCLHGMLQGDIFLLP